MLLDLKNCSGQLCWHENSLNINFDLSVAKDGSIKLTVKDIPFGKDVLWLDELIHKKARYFELLQLKGYDVEGDLITSDSVALTCHGERIDEAGSSWRCIEGTCMQFRLDSPKPLTYGKAAALLLQYRLLGFKCFDRLSGNTDIGSIQVVGSTKIENYDKATGVLTIRNQPEQNFALTNWIERCDKSVRSILDILSLANDRYIAWTSRSIFHNKSWISSLFIGPRRAGKPFQPLFTYLNLQPILNLAIANYSEELKQKTGLDVAIEWFLIKSTYTEVQFLTAMTALEHLIYIYSGREEREKIFQNKTFEKIIRPQVNAALDRTLDLLLENEEDTVKRESYLDMVKTAKNKVAEINRYPFKDNLRKFLKEYKVPLDGIDQNIEPAIDVRHKIVHRGIYISGKSTQSINDHLAVLRELLARIFLTLLKYSGEYQSFLNGPEWKKFLPLQ
jgi:hypothetical protein